MTGRIDRDELRRMLTCTICCDPYDLQNKKPMNFACGHTYCANCILVLMQTDLSTMGLSCPSCRRRTPFQSLLSPLESFATNFFITDLIELSAQWGEDGREIPCSMCHIRSHESQLTICKTCSVPGTADDEYDCLKRPTEQLVCGTCARHHHSGHSYHSLGAVEAQWKMRSLFLKYEKVSEGTETLIDDVIVDLENTKEAMVEYKRKYLETTRQISSNTAMQGSGKIMEEFVERSEVVNRYLLTMSDELQRMQSNNDAPHKELIAKALIPSSTQGPSLELGLALTRPVPAVPRPSVTALAFPRDLSYILPGSGATPQSTTHDITSNFLQALRLAQINTNISVAWIPSGGNFYLQGYMHIPISQLNVSIYQPLDVRNKTLRQTIERLIDNVSFGRFALYRFFFEPPFERQWFNETEQQCIITVLAALMGIFTPAGHPYVYFEYLSRNLSTIVEGFRPPESPSTISSREESPELEVVMENIRPATEGHPGWQGRSTPYVFRPPQVTEEQLALHALNTQNRSDFQFQVEDLVPMSTARSTRAAVKRRAENAAAERFSGRPSPPPVRLARRSDRIQNNNNN